MMTRKIKTHLPFTFCCLLFVVWAFYSGCNKKDDFTADFHYDYAPVDSGHYVIYDVDSINYRYYQIQDSVGIDTIRYQLMELVGDTVNFNNEEHYELNLYRRADENSAWTYDRKWYIKRQITNFIKVEDDIKFVKLVFPPVEDAEWNGNIYVPTTTPLKEYLDWDYHYESVHVPFSINGLSFDSAITVAEADNETVISKIFRREVYAKGVGMVYQEWESLHIPSGGQTNTNWETGKFEGFRLRMKVHSYYP